MKNNKIDINSKYKAKISFDDYSNVNDILVSYYLPIIKSEAFSFYSALVIDSRNNMINSIYVPIERLVSMINISVENMENAISRLELVNLVEIFKNENNEVTFKLNKPLTPEEFNKSEQFVGLLKSSAGTENLYINNKLFNSLKEHNFDEEHSITKKVDISSKVEVPLAKLNVEFDFDSIKNILNAKQIDWSLYWSNELEQELLNVIVIYRITSFDIAVELIKEIETDNFNMNNVISNIRNNFIKKDDITALVEAGDNTTEAKLDFLSKLSVRDYFVHRLGRVPSTTEEEMIVKLINSYKLNDYQINILIDYSVIINGGAVNKNYIFKIADTIIKENIDTPNKLVNHLKMSYKVRNAKGVSNKNETDKPLEEKPIFK